MLQLSLKQYCSVVTCWRLAIPLAPPVDCCQSEHWNVAALLTVRRVVKSSSRQATSVDWWITVVDKYMPKIIVNKKYVFKSVHTKKRSRYFI